MGERTYADGGSATTQASDNVESWRPRPIVALLVRSLTVLAPIIASFAMTRVYGLIMSPDVFGGPAYWTGLMITAIVTAVAVEKETQGVIPLAALFRMSLVFPDQAPNRFGLALRDGTANKLKAKAEATGDSEAAADLLVLVRELSRHDPQTRGHSERVRAYADMIAEQMGLSEVDRQKLAWGALAHDVGKIDVRPSTLNKPGRPNEEEWAEIRNHPAAAVDRMASVEPWLGEWALAASQHHERWDGNGYPLGLKGEDISLAGRIVAVADAYDVMTATRSYKKPLAPEIAREELINNAESQFDPEVVRAFLQVGMRRLHLAGPLAWLNELAWFVRAPQAISSVGTTAVTTTATATLAVGTAIAAGPVEPPVASIDEVAAERIVVDEAGDPINEPITVDGEAVTVLPAPDAPATAGTGGEPGGGDGDSSGPTVETTGGSPGNDGTPGDESPSSTSSASLPEDESPDDTTQPSNGTTEPQVQTTTPTTEVVELEAPVLLGAASGGNHHRLPMDADLEVGENATASTILLERETSLDAARAHSHSHVHFQLPSGDGLRLNGVPTLTIWAATRDFVETTTGAIHIELFDCNDAGSGCAQLGEGLAEFAQADFGDGFGRVEIELDAVDATLDPGRMLVLDLHVDPSSDADLWLGFGSTTYPASLHVR